VVNRPHLADAVDPNALTLMCEQGYVERDYGGWCGKDEGGATGRGDRGLNDQTSWRCCADGCERMNVAVGW